MIKPEFTREEAVRKDNEFPKEARYSEDLIAEYKQDMSKGELKPRYIQWVITDQCQFHCSHCETTATQDDIQQLTTPQAKKVLDQLSELGCEFLSITGGEPMLRKDLFEIAHYAKEKGLNLGLTTNGQATEENISALSDIKFDSVVS